MQELDFFVLLLHNVPGIRDKVLYKILKAIYYEGISPTRFLEFSYDVYREKFQLSHEASLALSKYLPEHLRKTADFQEKLKNSGFSIISVFHSAYPDSLKDFLGFPPPVLYVRGNLSILNGPTFTILNSRDADEECVEILKGADFQGVLIAGLYGPGYRYAPGCKNPRVGISDRGVIQISKKRMQMFDVVVSFSGMDDMGTPWSMRMRDKVVVALSDKVVGGCIREGGNMFELILEAKERGKDVCVLDRGVGGNRGLIELGVNPCKILNFA